MTIGLSVRAGERVARSSDGSVSIAHPFKRSPETLALSATGINSVK